MREIEIIRYETGKAKRRKVLQKAKREYDDFLKSEIGDSLN